MFPSPLRLLFLGTSSFAVPALRHLANDKRFLVTTVITQPDRPVGRHATLTPPPVKTTAQELKIPVLQFEHVKKDDAWDILKELHADVGVVASFGQIIPQRLLDLPRLGMVNIHTSLLPLYRGASPIAEAIKNGDTETGVTIMKMDALLDHGPILHVAHETILPTDTTASLEERLAKLGAEILPDTLIAYAEGQLTPQEQDHTKATSVKLLSREDGQLDWQKTAEELERLVRAYHPWPGTFTMLDGKRLKIFKTLVGPTSSRSPGSRFMTDQLPCITAGQNTSLCLLEVQPEGKAMMTGEAFLRGNMHWETVH